MGITIKGKHFLALEDFTPDQIRYLLDLAHELKAQKYAGVDQRKLYGKNLLMLFEMGSTRTRCAFETSAHDLGMGTTYLANSHFGKKETIKDSMRVFSGMYDAVVYRGETQEQLLEMAKYSGIPVINGFTNYQHPTQMLADFMTLEERWGRNGFKGKTLCLVGVGGGGVANSYAVMCALLGMNFKFVRPNQNLTEGVDLLNDREKALFYEALGDSDFSDVSNILRPDEVERVTALFQKYSPNCTFLETEDMDEVKGADIIITENWGPFTMPVATWLPGIKILKDYQVNKAVLERTGNPDVKVMHMLPASHNCDHSGGRELLQIVEPELRDFLSKGLEMTDEVFEMNADIIFREAENRQHTIKAVLAAVIGM